VVAYFQEVQEMPGEKPVKTGSRLVLSVGALFVVGYLAARSTADTDRGDVPAEAAGWYGAMSLYRSLAMWAGKRAIQAELQYWKTVGAGR
jgi:hypothetical protein